MYLPKILFAIASLVLLSPGLANDPPDLISYQGVLNDNFGVPLDDPPEDKPSEKDSSPQLRRGSLSS